jgi:hypothetical protein
MSRSSMLGLFFVCFASAAYAGQTAPALTADFTIEISPSNGVSRQMEGHYARSSDGKIREETPAFVTITDPKARTASMLNPATKTAVVLKFGPNATAGHQMETPSASTNPLTAFEDAQVDGHPVVKKRSGLATGGRALEIWMATDISLPLFVKTSASTRVTTTTFKNIALKEPDPALFTVPPGYKVINRNDDGSCPLPECSSKPATTSEPVQPR